MDNDIDEKVDRLFQTTECIKSSGRTLYYWLGGFALGFTVMLMLFFPVLGDKTGIEYIQDLLQSEMDTSPVTADEPSENSTLEAYHYWYAPENSFGISSTKTVNWSYFKQLFLSHTDWMLEYKRYEYSDWTDGSDYLTIERTWNESGFWKFNLILDVPVHVYSARFTFGIDLNCLQYVERSGHEVWINYTANATETYSVMFNWSDIASIPNLVITKGKTNEMFWFRFRRDDIPAGVYVFDPNFGNSEIGSNSQVNADIDDIWGGNFTLSESGTADNITFYTRKVFSNTPTRCLIYDSDKNFVANGQTDEVTLTSTTPGWIVFPFSGTKPSLSAGDYFLCFHCSGGGAYGAYLYYNTTGGIGTIVDLDNGNNYANYPATLTQDVWESNDLVSIYCSYAEGAANNAPTITGEIPANTSTGISLQPTCNVTVNDADGDTMNVTFASNYSGSWVNYQTNSTVGNGSYAWNASPAFNTELTKYWWKVYADDATDNTSEIYYFTTAANETWQIVISTINGTYSNTTIWKTIINTINGTYSNTTVWKPIITTINGTYSNTTQWKVIINTINGTYSNTTTWKPTSTTINGTYSNTTAWTIIIDTINGTYSNTSAISWNIISSTINGTYSNTTIWEAISTTINGTYSNETITWNAISTTINGTYSNTSKPLNITITNPYPANESTSIPLQIITYVTITNIAGNTMTLRFYYGNSTANATIQLGATQSGLGNGTYNQLFYPATNYSTTYYWRVYANDGTNYVNNTFNFTTTAILGGGGGISRSVIGLIGIIGLIGLFGGLMYSKRKRRRYEEHEDRNKEYQRNYWS